MSKRKKIKRKVYVFFRDDLSVSPTGACRKWNFPRIQALSLAGTLWSSGLEGNALKWIPNIPIQVLTLYLALGRKASF